MPPKSATGIINHENIHFRFRTLTRHMCCWIVDLNYLTLQLLCALNYWIIVYCQGLNTKNVIYLNVVYVYILHFMIKLMPDLESTHQAGH